MIMFDANVADIAIEPEGEGENVVVVAAVAHQERAIRFVSQQPLGGFARQWTPVPPVVLDLVNTGSEIRIDGSVPCRFNPLQAVL